jgi:predicted dehydrogenase
MKTILSSLLSPSAHLHRIVALAAAILGLHGATFAAGSAAPTKVGIIGLDAHAVPWTQIIQGPKAVPGAFDLRIVATYPGGSPDVPFSKDNIEKNTAKMRELGVEICDSIETMLTKVDAVLLLSIDGRPHPEQARPVFAAKKPLFIDKPVAASLVETIEVLREAKESGTPCFSNSSLRYGPVISGMARDPKVGRVLGCTAYSNNKGMLPGHPDLFYYGIHGCEILFTVMGPGCKTVTRVKSATADEVVGVWADGRLGTFHGILQGSAGFGATVYGEKSIVHWGKFEGYEPLIREIAKFFRSGQPPISVEHTLEIYAFMEAADESARQGGRAVDIQAVLAKAQKQADARRKK